MCDIESLQLPYMDVVVWANSWNVSVAQLWTVEKDETVKKDEKSGF